MAAWFIETGSAGQQELIICQNVGLTKFVALEYRPDKSNGVYFNSDFAGVQFGTTALPSANVWSHAAITSSSATSHAAYLNGGNKVTNSGTLSGATASTQTWLGSYKTSGGAHGGFFAGTIADAAIWSVALSDAEIAALASGVRPKDIRPASLIAYWPLGGLQSPEPDISGGARNGTLTGTSAAFGPPYVPFTPRWPQFSEVVAAPTFQAAWAMGKNIVIEGVAT
jgi:hypothetical protein